MITTKGGRGPNSDGMLRYYACVLQSDWGAGVVCGGKLCGVVSRSARGADGSAGGLAAAAGRDEPQCGDTHAAQSVARWRRFLHCAHTLRACGR